MSETIGRSQDKAAENAAARVGGTTSSSRWANVVNLDQPIWTISLICQVHTDTIVLTTSCPIDRI